MTTNTRHGARFLVLALILTTWGCDQGPVETGSLEDEESPAQSVEVAALENGFEEVAASLALALQHPDLRTTLKTEFEKKFTGAPEVLYRSARDLTVSEGVTLQQQLVQSRASLRGPIAQKLTTGPGVARTDVDAVAQSIPRLHIAMPVHLDVWDATSEVPLVAYVPPGIDDQELEQIKAFDADGQVHWLDAEIPPDHPVIVVATNERTDDEGNLLGGFLTLDEANTFTPDHNEGPGCVEPQGLNNSEAMTESCGGGGGGSNDPYLRLSPRQSGQEELIYKVNVQNDHENWFYEPEEIRVRVMSPRNSSIKDSRVGNGDLPEGKWGTENYSLLRWHLEDIGNYIVLFWYEEDDGQGKSTHTFSYTDSETRVKTDYKIEFTKDHDEMGHSMVHRKDPSTRIYSTGDVKWTQRWR